MFEDKQTPRSKFADVRGISGTLIKCDPSIRVLILQIDRENGGIFVRDGDLDDEHLLVNSDKVESLKVKLGEAIKIVDPIGNKWGKGHESSDSGFEIV